MHMWKRSLAALAVVLVAVTILSTPLIAQTKADGSRFEKSLGLAFPNYGTVHYGDDGFIHSITGFNLGLGFSYRYYDDGLIPEDVNMYWGWGTVLLIVPYFEVGAAYPIPVGANGNLLVLEVGLVYIIPRIGISMMF